MLKENLASMPNIPRYVIDLDFDFFFDSEHHIASFPWKKKILEPKEFILKHPYVQFSPIVGHDEALDKWDEAKITNLTCIHIDYHHDLFMAENLVSSIKAGQRATTVNCGNYLYFALKCGYFQRLIWVYPDTKAFFDKPVLPSEFIRAGIDLACIPYSHYMAEIHPLLNASNCLASVAAISPDFVPIEFHDEFIALFGGDQEFLFRVKDYYYENVYSQTVNMSLRRYHSVPSIQSPIFWHGSPLGNLQTINPNGEYSHCSSSIGFASCYGLNLANNLGWEQGIDSIIDRDERIYLITPEKFDPSARMPFSIYQVNFDKANGFSTQIDGYDQIVKGQLEILTEIICEDAIEEAKKYGVLIYSKKIVFHRELDWPLPLPEDFVRWMGVPSHQLEKYPSAYFFGLLYSFIKNVEAKPSFLPFFPISFWLRWISRNLAPKLFEYRNLEADTYHGLSHMVDVAIFALVIAIDLDINPLPSVFAALTHDTVRDNADNRRNAAESAQVLAQMLGLAWSEYLGDWLPSAIQAVIEHPLNSTSSSIHTSILRDADRLRLSWERGYSAEYFATDMGKHFAAQESYAMTSLIKYLAMDEHQVLELHGYADDVIYMLWSHGKRYQLSRGGLSVDLDNLMVYLIQFNVCELVLFDISPEILAEIDSLGLPRPIKLSLYQGDDNSTLLNQIVALQLTNTWTIYTPSVNQNIRNWGEGVSQLHILAVIENLSPQKLADIFELSEVSDENTLFSLDFSDELSLNTRINIDEILVKMKKKPEAPIIKIRGDFPWCVFDDPHHVNLLCEPRGKSYVPRMLIGSANTIHSAPNYKVIRNLHQEQYAICSGCAYLTSCGGYIGNDGKFKTGDNYSNFLNLNFEVLTNPAQSHVVGSHTTSAI